VRFVIDTVVETSDFNGKKLQWDVVSGAQASAFRNCRGARL